VATKVNNVRPLVEQETAQVHRTNRKLGMNLDVRSILRAIDFVLHVAQLGREPQSGSISPIVRSNIADLGSPSFQNESSLFKAYTVPHCDRDGKECLEISKVEDTNVIDIAVKGAKSTQLGEVKGARDAVWSPANDGSVYVLKTCPAP
jgi:hypothetical protein